MHEWHASLGKAGGWCLGSSLVVVIELGLGRGLCHRTVLKKKNERRRKVLTVVAQYRQERGWGCRHQVTLGLELAVVASSGEAGPGTGRHCTKLGSLLLSLGRAESVLIGLKKAGSGHCCRHESWGGYIKKDVLPSANVLASKVNISNRICLASTHLACCRRQQCR